MQLTGTGSPLEAVQNPGVARLLCKAREQLDRLDVDYAGDPNIARMSFALEFLYEAVLELAPKAA